MGFLNDSVTHSNRRAYEGAITRTDPQVHQHKHTLHIRTYNNQNTQCNDCFNSLAMLAPSGVSYVVTLSQQRLYKLITLVFLKFQVCLGPYYNNSHCYGNEGVLVPVLRLRHWVCFVMGYLRDDFSINYLVLIVYIRNQKTLLKAKL